MNIILENHAGIPDQGVIPPTVQQELQAESTLGEGSRFLVDIPEGVRKPGPVKA